jgi:hypothetical protein
MIAVRPGKYTSQRSLCTAAVLRGQFASSASAPLAARARHVEVTRARGDFAEGDAAVCHVD